MPDTKHIEDERDCKTHERRLDLMENNQAVMTGWTRGVAGILVLVLLPLGGWASASILTELSGIKALMQSTAIENSRVQGNISNIERRLNEIDDRHKFEDQTTSRGLFKLERR
jgi:hypothetical protein